jgi:transposase
LAFESSAFEPLLPPEPPKGRGGRPRIPNRDVLRGILLVLSTGLPWEYLPPEMGCGSGLKEWHEAGVWQRLHRALLEKLNEAGRIDWSRAALDASSVPAQKGVVKPGRIRRIAANRARSTILWSTPKESRSR